MSDAQTPETKTHYICQTYTAQSGGQGGLKIDKQFEYSNAAEAQNRAEREAAHDSCAGADAYMVIEDLKTGEVGSPEFLVRLGDVPVFDDF